MTSDRELLEYAAKAVWGYFPTKSTERGVQIGLYSWWNPRTDDGDAFRLMVDLNLTEKHSFLDRLYEEKKACGLDYRKATRRAIVRAAAEVGRNMSG